MEELVAAAVQFVAQQFQLVAQVSSDLSGLAEELLSRLAQASIPVPQLLALRRISLWALGACLALLACLSQTRTTAQHALAHYSGPFAALEPPAAWPWSGQDLPGGAAVSPMTPEPTHIE